MVVLCQGSGSCNFCIFCILPCILLVFLIVICILCVPRTESISLLGDIDTGPGQGQNQTYLMITLVLALGMLCLVIRSNLINCCLNVNCHGIIVSLNEIMLFNWAP